MSDEQKKQDEQDVEAHARLAANDEPTDEAEGDVEAHIRAANARYDSPRAS